jgi:Arc/MetJ-type ribon-helix-helix transcriptional regulator
MKRTTISLPDDLAAALEREAGRRRVSVSEVAREAIEDKLGFAEEGERDLPFIGIADGELTVGDFDEYLAKHWADDIYRDAFSDR